MTTPGKVRHLLGGLLFVGALLLASCSRPAAPDALRPKGDGVGIANIGEYSILIPEKATSQEKAGAAMLADYLGKIFQVKLPVLREPQPNRGKLISVGNTALAAASGIVANPREQSYKLAVSGGNLFILGGTRGPIYGVIALLEEDLGCRWYMRDDAQVIPGRSQDLFTVVPRSYSPPFEVREPLYLEAFHPKWAAFNRLQTVSFFNPVPLESGGGLANSKYFVHTYNLLIPAEKYFPIHPEFFPLLNGKRQSSTPNNGQLCYTAPGLPDAIAGELEADIARNPATRIYSVSANDNVFDNCECPSCQKLIKQDGVAGAQLFLANEVAGKLALKYPDIKITTLAYVGSQKPPKHIKPGPNTVILYAPIRQRYSPTNMLLPIGEIRHIQEELEGWHRIASSIYLWDYVDVIGGAPIPFPNFDPLENGWDFLIANGVTGIFLQGCFLGHGSLGELKSWLYAKKLWNPKWSQDDLIQEFVHSYYGPAAAEMAAYVALQRNAWQTFRRDFTPGMGLKFSGQEKKQMYELLEAALADCAGQPTYQERIERELLTLLSLSLSAARPESLADYSSKLSRAEALITKLKVKGFGEGTTVEEKLSSWRNKLKSASGENQLPKYSPNSVTVKKPVCPLAKYLPDPDAALGLAARQASGNSAWGVQWPFDDFWELLEPGKTYVVRMRCRPEFHSQPSQPGVLFTLGYHYSGVGGTATYPANFSADDNGSYRWANLFRLQVATPGISGLFYSIPGSGLNAGDAVWYDYLEFVPMEEFKDREMADSLPLVKI